MKRKTVWELAGFGILLVTVFSVTLGIHCINAHIEVGVTEYLAAKQMQVEYPAIRAAIQDALQNDGTLQTFEYQAILKVYMHLRARDRAAKLTEELTGENP